MLAAQIVDKESCVAAFRVVTILDALGGRISSSARFTEKQMGTEQSEDWAIGICDLHGGILPGQFSRENEFCVQPDTPDAKLSHVLGRTSSTPNRTTCLKTIIDIFGTSAKVLQLSPQRPHAPHQQTRIDSFLGFRGLDWRPCAEDCIAGSRRFSFHGGGESTRKCDPGKNHATFVICLNSGEGGGSRRVSRSVRIQDRSHV